MGQWTFQYRSRLNRKQKIAAWAGVILIQFMILLPPISRTELGPRDADLPIGSAEVTGHTVEYGFIVVHYARINYSLLAAQLAVVATVSGGLTYLFRDKIRI